MKEKYSLVEAAGMFAVTLAMCGGMIIIAFPVAVLIAWMRMTVWNWYCPMVHLPPVSLWLMVVIGAFVGGFMPVSPSLKDEFLKTKAMASAFYAVAGQILGFGIIALIHIWFHA